MNEDNKSSKNYEGRAREILMLHTKPKTTVVTWNNRVWPSKSLFIFLSSLKKARAFFVREESRIS